MHSQRHHAFTELPCVVKHQKEKARGPVAIRAEVSEDACELAAHHLNKPRIVWAEKRLMGEP